MDTLKAAHERAFEPPSPEGPISSLQLVMISSEMAQLEGLGVVEALGLDAVKVRGSRHRVLFVGAWHFWTLRRECSAFQ